MDDQDGTAPEQREDRGPRIPPAKLSSIEADPKVSIFYKPNKRSATTLIDSKLPQAAAMIFCDRIRNDLMENKGSKSYTIVGGDLDGIKEVLAWIKECVAEQSIVKFKEVDESTPGFFTAYTNILLAGYILGIPARDLSDPLLKRMTAIARKKLMKWDEVEWFYQTTFPSTLPPEKEAPLRAVAAASIFWAWWNANLDRDETPTEMCILDKLRQEIPKLDEDLHECCVRQEAEVRRKWDEKDKAKKYGSQSSTGFTDGGGDGGGWGEPADTSGHSAGGWEAPTAPATTGGWENLAAATTTDNGVNTWESADALSDEPFAPPNSLASPEICGAKSTTSAALLPPLHDVSNTNGFGGGANGFHGNGGGGRDWAEEVNEQVEDQGQQYGNDQW